MSDIKKVKDDVTVTKRDENNFRLFFSSFFKNEHHTFVVQKTEKLASAVYLVTGFISADDPLKSRLRTCVLDLVSAVTDHEAARNLHYHEGFGSRCLEIASIVTLAQRAGFISSMNARILCDEYAGLAVFVKNHRDKVFGVRAGDVVGVDEYPSAAVEAVKDTSEDKGHFKKTMHKRHLNRKDIILSLLENKQHITINDALQAVEGCSEKTIQRELISMVEAGLLMKEGERRWSTYRRAT